MANVKEQNVENLNSKEAFFVKYQKPILIAVAAIILIIAGTFLYKNFVSEPREAEASTAIAKDKSFLLIRNSKRPSRVKVITKVS